MSKHYCSFGALIVLLVLAHLVPHAKCDAMQVPQDIKKMATLITVEYGDGSTGIGTGFIVGIPNVKDQGKSFNYFVTAKHMFVNSEKPNLLPTKGIVRFNKEGTGYEDKAFAVSLEDASKNVFFHSDPSVDLAVIKMAGDVNGIDIIGLDESSLAPKDVFMNGTIKEGTDVFLLGILNGLSANQRVCQICRFGKVALAEDEKISVDGMPQHLYLIEILAYGGNSGGPVFFYPSPDNVPGVLAVGGHSNMLLAGVVKGFLNDFQPIQAEGVPLKTSTGKDLVSVANNGIAAVTPAYLLREILFSEELTAERKAEAGPEQK